MNVNVIAGVTLEVGLLASSQPVLAHHGSAMYDASHTVTVKGTVTSFEFMNPHCAIHFDVKDEKGSVISWTADTNNPSMLARGGWTKDSVKPGDEITVVGNPAKSGSSSLLLKKVVLPNGKELDPGAAY